MSGELGARLLELAKERKALIFGEFTLSSGQKSRYYFDGRLLSLDPEGASILGEILFDIAQGCDAQAIGGLTLGADAMVAATALVSHRRGHPIPAFIVRSEQKGHGTQKKVEGHLPPGSRVMVVDDVITTGGSLFRAIEAAEEVGCKVVKVIAVLDRHQGGSEELRRRGYSFQALLEATPQGEVTVVEG